MQLQGGARRLPVSYPRPVAIPLYLMTKERLGVISPVEDPAPCCARIVVVPIGAVRLCVDFTELNHHALRDWHPIP